MNHKDILSLQLELYIKLAKIAQKQISFLEQEKLDSFMNLWSQRKKLQAKIVSLQKKNPVGAYDPELKIKIQEIQGVLKDADEKMKKIVEEKKENLNREFSKLKSGQKALRGYAPKRISGSRFITTQG